jgi:hypothetical protein
MPDLNSLPVPQFTGAEPYHHTYDNIPLKVLADRDNLINSSVDIQSAILKDCAGSAGSLANRLNQSLDLNGAIKTQAVNASLHDIANHTDGSITLSTPDLNYFQSLGYPSLVNPVDFVRMLGSERDKLTLIQNEATDLKIDVYTAPSTTISFGDGTIGTLNLIESDSISWTFESPNSIKPEIKFSLAYAHRHYYEIEPVTSDYLNYTVNGPATPYIEGSLRVYINGVRINSYYSVYVPNDNVTSWTANRFVPDHLNGSFYLDAAITSNDIIMIDFDISVT